MEMKYKFRNQEELPEGGETETVNKAFDGQDQGIIYKIGKLFGPNKKKYTKKNRIFQQQIIKSNSIRLD